MNRSTLAGLGICLALVTSFFIGRASVRFPERRLMSERAAHRETIVAYWPVETLDERGTLRVMYAPERMQPEWVRLRGIYLPQPGEPMHDEAITSLASMIEGVAIALDFDGQEVQRDEAGRLFAYAWANTGGTDFCLNVELVRLGMARHVPSESGALTDELQQAERKAREARRGIWGQNEAVRHGG
ncbi:MAG: thermonuclease family protein [Pirellulales bacterium]|nr:thermonuclease family protein [Pirellulales bacterium]